MDNMRNMVLAIVLSALVLFGWSMVSERYFPAPKPAATAVAAGHASGSQATPAAGATPPADSPAALRNRAVVLAEAPRVRIDTPNLAGSINLKGARIDDLVLKRHRQTIAENSPPVRLLSPAGAAHAYFASFGWTGDNVKLPGPDTVWTADATALTPGKPLTLSWDNGAGQVFTIRLVVDADYMFTVRQTVANNGAAPVATRPYSVIARYGESPDPHDKSSWTIHTGPVGFWSAA